MEPNPAERSDPPMPAPSVPGRHLGYLDGLRGLSALAVVISHIIYTTFPGNFPSIAINSQENPTGFLRELLMILRDGRPAVCVFLAISGFCLAIPVLKRNYTLRDGTLGFFWRRTRRIVPPYFFALIGSSILAFTVLSHPTGSHWDVAIPVTKQDLITHILLIQDLFASTTSKINHVFWSISVEWRIYFVFPLMLMAFRKLGFKKGLYLCIGLTLLFTAVFKHFGIFNNGGLIYFGTIFLFGVFAADYCLNRTEYALSPKFWIAASYGFFAILLASSVVQNHRTFPGTVVDLAAGAWGCCLMIAVHQSPRCWAGRVLNYRPWVVLGTMGYSLYLIHAPIVQLAWQYGVRFVSDSLYVQTAVLFVVGVALSIAATYGFYYLCEKPFINKPSKIEPTVKPVSATN